MTPSPFDSIFRTSAIAALCALAANAACAGDWRQAHVRSVGPRPAADAGIDLDCAPERATEPAGRVLVVSYRTGKSHYWRAFNLAADDAYAAGDEVIVNVQSCSVARVQPVADPAASAP